MLIFQSNSLEDQDTPIDRVYLALSNVFNRVKQSMNRFNEMVKYGLAMTPVLDGLVVG